MVLSSFLQDFFSAEIEALPDIGTSAMGDPGERWFGALVAWLFPEERASLLEPRFHLECAQKWNNRHLPAAPGFFESLRKPAGIDNSKGDRNHLARDRDYAAPLLEQGDSWASRDESLPLPVKDGVGYDSPQCAPHQGSALARSHELFSRNGEQELQEVSIQIGVAPLAGSPGPRRGAADLPAHGIERFEIRLKAGRRAAEF
jgi:hypothetical protein